jgi:hypothetical protein
MSKIHAMIDIETLDTTPSSVVLSVGAVKFDPYTNNSPHAKTLWRPGVDEQLVQGRTTSESTLEWWSKQEAHIRESTFTEDGRIQLNQFFKELNKYLVGVDKIWCQGPQFDMVILEDLFKQSNHHQNWAFWQVCDCRTIFNMMPADPRKAIQQDLHSAEEDSYWQAVCVQQTFNHFRVVSR